MKESYPVNEDYFKPKGMGDWIPENSMLIPAMSRILNISSTQLQFSVHLSTRVIVCHLEEEAATYHRHLGLNFRAKRVSRVGGYWICGVKATPTIYSFVLYLSVCSIPLSTLHNGLQSSLRAAFSEGNIV